MRPTLQPLPEVRHALSLLQTRSSAPLDKLECWKGRVAELSEAGYWGALSLAALLIAQTQTRGEQTAWLEAGGSGFFPPDLAARGIDLESVIVVKVRTANAVLQAADWLLRSGAFGLVVIDGFEERVADTELGRLGRLAEDADTALVFLTHKREDEPSLGTQVSMRAAVKSSAGDVHVSTLKDRRGAHSEVSWRLHGPLGLY